MRPVCPDCTSTHTKKKGIRSVPGAKQTLEGIEMQINEIVGKYTAIDGRTADVKARKKTAEQVRENIAEKDFQTNLEFAKKHSKLFNLTIKDDLTAEQIKEQYGQESADALGFIDEKTNLQLQNPHPQFLNHLSFLIFPLF